VPAQQPGLILREWREWLKGSRLAHASSRLEQVECFDRRDLLWLIEVEQQPLLTLDA
jgi:hypothetical protein